MYGGGGGDRSPGLRDYNKSPIATLRYAERLANRNMRRTTMMILGAWCMALVICLPMHIKAPGFASFIVTEDTAKDCMPPVSEDSTESIYNYNVFTIIKETILVHPLTINERKKIR